MPFVPTGAPIPFVAIRPWTAEPMDSRYPDAAWRVRATSRAGGPGETIATHLTREDAEDIVKGVNRIEAERRIAAEDPLQHP